MSYRSAWFLMKTLCSTALSLLGCIPGLASAAGGTTDERLHVFHHDNVLGTSLDLKVVAAAPAEAERAEAATLAEIDQLARILSTYDATSEISRWLRTCRTPIPVSAEPCDTGVGRRATYSEFGRRNWPRPGSEP